MTATISRPLSTQTLPARRTDADNTATERSTDAPDTKPTPRAGGLTLEQSEAFGAAMDELREQV
ncbi:MAG: acyl-CoA desaturase, partial [Candidatus Neomicrothrix subdominans]